MSKKTVFVVRGKVRGKPRPRVNRSGSVWTPAVFTEYERSIAEAYLRAGGEMHEGQVRVHIATHRALPASKPKRIKAEPDTVKPDVDNIAKIVLDALNGIAYKDDSQVTGLYVTKLDRARREEYLEVMVESTSD